MIYIYYRKSDDLMIMVDTEPEEDWKKNARQETCEFQIKGDIIFDKAMCTLTRDQDLVSYALRIDIERDINNC